MISPPGQPVKANLPFLPQREEKKPRLPPLSIRFLNPKTPMRSRLPKRRNMRHKNGTMQRGGERKAAVEAATTPEEVEAA